MRKAGQICHTFVIAGPILRLSFRVAARYYCISGDIIFLWILPNSCGLHALRPD
jgi:hypothetical protein